MKSRPRPGRQRHSIRSPQRPGELLSPLFMSLNPAAFQEKYPILLPGLCQMGQILPDILQLVCVLSGFVISGSVPDGRGRL